MSCDNFVSTSRREPFQLDALFGPGHLRVATCSWPLARMAPRLYVVSSPSSREHASSFVSRPRHRHHALVASASPSHSLI